MKRETFDLEIITPCFCGGAEPEKRAEIRAPSIRGQLRWWFRTLGGFKSLANSMSVKEQEAMVFGSAAGEVGNAGKLIVRIFACDLKSSVKDGQELGHKNFSDPAYLTFPMQSRERHGQKTLYAGRGVLESGSFKLQIVWRGGLDYWADIHALIGVFGNLGALGFRGRRAMGALAFHQNAVDLRNVLNRFANPHALTIRTLGATYPDQALVVLGRWLKGWRAYGQTGKNTAEQQCPGFTTAKEDHDHGVARLAEKTKSGSTYRPALGLPIVQFFSSSKQTVRWEYDWDRGTCKPFGRFASPVVLRPHKDGKGNWHALVIFVDAHQWSKSKSVFLNGQPRQVSLDLYEAMKNDPALKPFP